MRRLLLLLLLLVLVLTLPRLARAQASGARPSPACHVDTIGVDTTVDTLYAWIPGIEQDQSQAEHAFQVMQVRAVLAALRPIPTLGMPDRPPRLDKDPRLGSTPLDRALALVWFQVRDNGRLSGMSVINWSGWDSLDLALQRAILRADSQRTLRPAPPDLAGQAVDLWLGVGHWQGNALADVTVAHVRRIGPRFRGVETHPRLLSFGYQPHFPEGAARAGLGDKLIVEFVVDTAGRVEPDSIVFLQATFREFAEEALKTIRAARYAPARIGGCPVRERTRESIFFETGERP